MNVTPATVFGKRHSRPTASTERAHSQPDNHIDTHETWDKRPTEVTLGNKELPIADYREQIVEAVDKHQVVIITAETGAGKSTQVPQFLAEQGYKVVITQPRVMAARTVSERIRDEIVARKGDEFSNFVGYKTAREGDTHPDNRILAVTDGLQLVRELDRRYRREHRGEKIVIMPDEVHEWNENMEVLVAWSKKRMKEDPDFKVVLMSATVESDALARYFADDDEREVPVIEVPGRTFKVDKYQGGALIETTVKAAREGKNTLVFVPGKGEIEQVIRKLQAANLENVTILPLHGGLSPEEQRKALAKYDGTKIVVSTNVAQTSLTIDDIDVVVDSGLERQKRVRDGVEGLYLNPISQADCLQRAGRAGRTHEGEYYLAQLDGSGVPFRRMEERAPYGTPEIERVLLDGAALRLARAGENITEMDFFHHLDEEEIDNAMKRLQKLGALNDEEKITDIGVRMERMPVEARYARMMLEAQQYSKEVRLQLAALLAVQEADGICMHSTDNNPRQESWRSLVSSEYNDSDMISQLEVFIMAQMMTDRERREYDIHTKAYSNANGILRQLRHSEGLKDANLTIPTGEERQQLVKCIIAGMVDSLYVSNGSSYLGADYDYRQATRRSIISPGKIIVGKPFDLQTGRKTLNLVEGVTNVPSIEVLREVAPHLYKETKSWYSLNGDQVVENYNIRFDGKLLGTFERAIAPGVERRRAYAEKAISNYRGKMIGHIDKQIKELSDKSGIDIPLLSNKEVANRLFELLPDDVDNWSEVINTDIGISIYEIVPQDMVEEINKESPDEYLGFPMRYENGVPYVEVDEASVLDLPAALEHLPDGREVKVGNRSIPEAREFIIQERERRELDKKIVDFKNQIADIFVPDDIPVLVDLKFQLLKEIDAILSRYKSNSEKQETLDSIPGKIAEFQQSIERERERVQREAEKAAQIKEINAILDLQTSKIRSERGLLLTKAEMSQGLLETRQELLQRIKVMSRGCTLDQIDDLSEDIERWLVALEGEAKEKEHARMEAYERRNRQFGRGGREPRGSRRPRGSRSRTDQDLYDSSLEGSTLAYISGGDGSRASGDVDGRADSTTPEELGYKSMSDMMAALAGQYGRQ